MNVKSENTRVVKEEKVEVTKQVQVAVPDGGGDGDGDGDELLQWQDENGKWHDYAPELTALADQVKGCTTPRQFIGMDVG